jgi:4-hydroxy-3-methylbut-2-enyl diphosphate reductase
MFYLDATCPLVSKVHLDAERHFEAGRQVVLVGHAGHPEVDGTLGQLPPGAIMLVETFEDAMSFEPRDPENLAFVTQTTLSMDDTARTSATPPPTARRPSRPSPRPATWCWWWARAPRPTRCGWWKSPAAPAPATPS